MNLTLPTILLAVCIAAVSSLIGIWHYRRADKPKLALAHLDLAGYVLAYGGLLSLLPESIRLYAPELIASFPNAGTIWERLDYAAFVLVSAGFGAGVTKRYLTVRYERH